MAVTINATTASGIQVSSDNSGTVQFQTSGTNTMYVDTTGYVGIGTSSPSLTLNVKSPTDYRAALFQTANTLGPSVQIQGSRIYELRSTDTGASEGGGLFFIYDKTAGASRVTVDSSGNLLVGTTTQVGSGKTVIRFTPGTTSGTAYQQSIDTSSPTPLNFLNAAGTSVGSVTTTSSATAYNVSSDYRLKENVNPITSGLKTISALKPVTYDWIIDKTAGEGFIAHELKEVVPLAVHGEKDDVDAEGKPVYQGVDYSKVVVHLVAAIQEQQATIASLTARIATLEAK